MRALAGTDDLIVLNGPEEAANGAPAGEPEVWSPDVVEANPLLAHLPEPEPVEVSPAFASHADFDISSYLEQERGKDLLRFSTAGSVDDGKSTLIGRLLYDTQSVYADQVRSIEGKGTTAPGVLDLALLTDGLRAEREQGITIDVAYRYFSTANRKFIIADTPGHEQYTRNMATGASTADVAIVLIDARKGVLAQSRRHAYITALLGVRHIIVAINKMDLVSYDQKIFKKIKEDFRAFFGKLDVDGIPAELHFVPVSALEGENVVHSSAATPWYSGPTLLALLESLPAHEAVATAPFRMSVQRVVRPNLDFRGFAGRIASGTVRPGDTLTILPSGKSSRIARISTFDGDLPEASAPLSVTLVFEDEIDISRGDLLVSSTRPAVLATSFTASLVWMDSAPLDRSHRYRLKHASRTVQARVTSVDSVKDLVQLTVQSQVRPAQQLSMNEIGQVVIETLQPLAFDTYAHNRHTGSFVLINLQTNATAAAGMIIRQVLADNRNSIAPSGQVPSAEARELRYGHRAACIRVADAAVADVLEAALFHRGCFVVRLTNPSVDIVSELLRSGAVIVAEDGGLDAEGILLLPGGAITRQVISKETEIAVAQVLQLLTQHGILRQGSIG